MTRFDQCTETCTTDCGHCKGQPVTDVGTYLLTAGALHRALGRIGHSAPCCQAEAERDAARAEVERLLGIIRLLRAEETTVEAERAERRQLTDLVGVRLLPAEHQAGLALARARGLTLPALLRLLLTNELALEPERSSGRRC
jgi:hypothetical protein